ncbi:hypothetical protein B5B97_02575 [Staphylococcus delphini]|nr:hypothetical protein B5B97_02575 [Staphylococcus delphini]PCF61143.1 hypothetical protein B5C05_02850 [Staphylococcus delphini]
MHLFMYDCQMDETPEGSAEPENHNEWVRWESINGVPKAGFSTELPRFRQNLEINFAHRSVLLKS